MKFIYNFKIDKISQIFFIILILFSQGCHKEVTHEDHPSIQNDYRGKGSLIVKDEESPQVNDPLKSVKIYPPLFKPSLYLSSYSSWLPGSIPKLNLKTREQDNNIRLSVYKIEDPIIFFFSLENLDETRLGEALLKALDMAMARSKSSEDIAPHVDPEGKELIGEFTFLYSRTEYISGESKCWKTKELTLSDFPEGLYLIEVSSKGESAFVPIFISKIKLFIKRFQDKILVWVLDLLQSKPLANHPVHYGSKKQLPLEDGVTDGNGVLLISHKNDEDIWIYTSAGQSFAIDRISPDYLAYSDKVFTDRKAYSPGEDISILGVGANPQDLLLVAPQGDILNKVNVPASSSQGKFSSKITIPSSASYGQFFLKSIWNDREESIPIIIAPKGIDSSKEFPAIILRKFYYSKGETVTIEIRSAEFQNEMSLDVKYLEFEEKGEGVIVDRQVNLANQGIAQFFYIPAKPGFYKVESQGKSSTFCVTEKDKGFEHFGIIPQRQLFLEGEDAHFLIQSAGPKLVFWGDKKFNGYNFIPQNYIEHNLTIPQNSSSLCLEAFSMDRDGKTSSLNVPLNITSNIPIDISIPDTIKRGHELSLIFKVKDKEQNTVLALWAVNGEEASRSIFFPFSYSIPSNCYGVGQLSLYRYQIWANHRLVTLYGEGLAEYNKGDFLKAKKAAEEMTSLSDQSDAAYELYTRSVQALGESYKQNDTPESNDIIDKLKNTSLQEYPPSLSFEMVINLISEDSNIPIEIFPTVVDSLPQSLERVDLSLKGSNAWATLNYLLAQRQLAYKIERGVMVIYLSSDQGDNLLDRLDKKLNQELSKLPGLQNSGEGFASETAFWFPWFSLEYPSSSLKVEFSKSGRWTINAVLLDKNGKPRFWKKEIWVLP